MIDINKLRKPEEISRLMELCSRYASRKIGEGASVRDIKVDDKDLILELSNKCFPYWDQGKDRDTVAINSVIGGEDSIGLVITSTGNGFIGYVLGEKGDINDSDLAGYVDKHTFYLYYGAIDEAFKRNGFYSMLNSLLHVIAHRAGYSRILLHAIDDEESTQPYLAKGYVKVKHAADYYMDGADAWLMKRRLDRHVIKEDIDFLDTLGGNNVK